MELGDPLQLRHITGPSVTGGFPLKWLVMRKRLLLDYGNKILPFQHGQLLPVFDSGINLIAKMIPCQYVLRMCEGQTTVIMAYSYLFFPFMHYYISRPGQSGRTFADGICKLIFLYENWFLF